MVPREPLAVRIYFIAVLLFCIGCAHQGVHRWNPNYTIHRDVLPNGLTVLYVEDHTSPVVSFVTMFKVGSAWEKPGATGIAHLFEHMMFKGTRKYPEKAFFKKLESKGAVVNASTQRDATTYYEIIASEHLELAIDMESDRLRNLVLTQKDLDAERQVVKEERRLRLESNFSAQQMEVLTKLSYPHHPYGWPVVGYQEDLDRLTLKECQNFFDTYYQPGNAIITIAGDFQYEQVKKLIYKYYAPIEGHFVPELILPLEKVSGKEKREEIYRPVKAESVLMGYYIPSMYERDTEKLSMLAWALFGMSSSRAQLDLVRDKQIALAVNAEASIERFPFLFVVSMDLKTGTPASVAEAELDRVIEGAKTHALSQEEIERVKNRLIYSMANEAKSPINVANWLAGGEFYWGDYKHMYSLVERYNQITALDLVEVAKKYLRKENRVVVVMKPEELRK